MVKIQMRQDGQWWTIGGVYDRFTADVRIMQFMECYMVRTGPGTRNCAREFRLIEATN